MKVKELIKELQKQNLEAEALVGVIPSKDMQRPVLKVFSIKHSDDSFVVLGCK